MKFSSATCLHPVPHRYQLDWFVDPNGNVLLDFIGRFETIDKDWETISQKLGIAAPLPRLNANPRDKHYSEYYSKETQKMVADRFAVDIEYFGYQFGG
jgi:hypothetical protein